MQLKKLYRAISDLEKKILGEQREKDTDEDGERNTQTVGILVKARPGSGGGVAGGAEVRGAEDEGEKWKRLLADHKEYVSLSSSRSRVANRFVDSQRRFRTCSRLRSHQLYLPRCVTSQQSIVSSPGSGPTPSIAFSSPSGKQPRPRPTLRSPWNISKYVVIRLSIRYSF